ncbi:MAG: catalase, partial [Methylobacteriaceae bacterium]|nr:catalase [Methylobacteriaceae bacterium]
MAWTETYAGGSPEAEEIQFKALAKDINLAQEKARQAAGAAHVDRAFHAKPILATDNAELQFRSDLAPVLTAGFAQPGARYPVTLRISNAANRPGPDNDPDMRGFAFRVHVSDAERHDFLATNYPVSHARNARQFVRVAVAMAGGSKVGGVVSLVGSEGPVETARMLINLSKARRKSDSVALETYWSRGAMRWGPALAVRFLLRPMHPAPANKSVSSDPNGLAKDIAVRLASAPVKFELAIQRYVDDRVTPIEDTSIAWETKNAPPEPVATLTIPPQDVRSPEAVEKAHRINISAFNPWNTTDEFRPLGNLNR